jgi:hypothetical protein
MTGLERWTTDDVHGDMWVAPDEDPRNNDGASPPGELPMYRDFLRNVRLTIEMKCEGLDAEQLARRSVPPSTMSLLGMLRHLADDERNVRRELTGASREELPRIHPSTLRAFEDAVADPAMVEAAYGDLAREQAATDEAIEAITDLSALYDGEGEVREVLAAHLEEYARHCGHADLLRECIDGRVGQ